MAQEELPPSYDPLATDKKWYGFWEEHKDLKGKAKLEAKKYVRAIQKAEEYHNNRGGLFYE